MASRWKVIVGGGIKKTLIFLSFQCLLIQLTPEKPMSLYLGPLVSPELLAEFSKSQESIEAILSHL